MNLTYSNQTCIRLRKTVSSVSFLFLLTLSNLGAAQTNLIRNSNFEEHSSSYSSVSSGIENVKDWYGINTVDYFRNGLDTANFLRISMEPVFEYAFCHLVEPTRPNQPYELTITIYGNLRKYALSCILLDSLNTTQKLDEFNIADWVRQSNPSIQLFDLTKAKPLQKHLNGWRTYRINIIPKGNYSMFLIGNCYQVYSKQQLLALKSLSLNQLSRDKTLN